MKLTGFVMIIASGLVLGLEAYLELKKRAEELGSFITLIRVIGVKVNFASDDIISILSEAEGAIADNIRNSGFFPGELEKAWESAAEKCFTKSSDRELFMNFFRDFGKLDTALQSDTIKNYIKEAEYRKQEAVRELKEKGRVKFITPLFLSLTLGLLLI